MRAPSSPDLDAIEAEPEEDARALDNIAAWCERFTPIVVLDPPDGLFLDITGCAHLFGGEAALRDQIVTRLMRKVSPRAPQSRRRQARPGRWRAMAAAASCREAASVQTLAPACLSKRCASTKPRLHCCAGLGFKTIGQLVAAPRASFTARAGEHAMLRLDQALGRAPEALTPAPACRRPVFALRRFLEPLFSVDAILDRHGSALRRCA